MAARLGRAAGIGCGTVLLVAVGLFLVVASGDVYLVEAPFLLAVGWIPYLVRVLPRVRPDWPAVGLFVGVLLVLLTAGHAFLAWLCARMTPPRRWTRRDSGLLLAGTLALFLTSMAISGITHQVGWLARPGEPLTRSSWENLNMMGRLSGLCTEVVLRSKGEPARVAELPIGDPEFHVVPLEVDGERVREFLVFPRDPEATRRLGGLRCGSPGGGGAVDAQGVAAALAELRRKR